MHPSSPPASAPRRRRIAALTAGLLALTLLPAGSLPAVAAATGATVSSTDVTIGDDRATTFTVSCSGKKSCAGTVTLSASGKIAAKSVRYSVKAGKKKALKFTLSATELSRLRAASASKLKVSLKLKQTAPSKRTTTYAPTLRAALKTVTVSSSLKFTAAGKGTLSVKCSTASTCVGTVTPVIAGVTGGKVAYSLKKGASKPIALSLSAAQRAKLGQKASKHTVKIAETGPERLAWNAAVSATIAATPKPDPKPDPEPVLPARAKSVAYTDRNWVPTALDTCPAALHASYAVTGPDGKIYPTWHPATVTNPATGESCTFGHEHGSDPSTSVIYDWVKAQLAPADVRKGEATGLPFGYVSEELNDYVHHHSGMSMRHEDNAGHKVYVVNNQTLLDADKEAVTFTDASGKTQETVCSYLVKQHQGSWSADATSNNAHELIYAQKCNDGTQIVVSMLSRFGNSNEFNQVCGAQNTVKTVGSLLPVGDGGQRLIPDVDCLSKAGNAVADWNLYELWKGDNKIQTETGETLAAFDPWFGIRDPSRYYDPAASTATTNGIGRPASMVGETAPTWASNPTEFPWMQLKSAAFQAAIAAEKANPALPAWQSPASPFSGSLRDMYLNQSTVSPSAGGTVYTDPYGKGAMTVAEHADHLAHASMDAAEHESMGVGYIKQLLVPGTATSREGLVLASQRTEILDFGNNNGVHAPN